MNKNLITRKQSSIKMRLQKEYEMLLQEIEDNRAVHKNLEEGLKTILPRIQSQIRPLISQRDDMIGKRLLRLDELADELGIDKYSRESLYEFMAEQAGELLNRIGFGDDELKNLYEKYAGESLLSDEETKNKMFEEQEAEDVEAMKNFDPTAKKEVSKQQQALLQDAKVIYIRLVKKYHPDRELDEAAKVQKTELTQRVTNAYKENDFLTLLKLQIEYLEEEETDARYLARDMLKRYNKILEKQLNEIKQEIDYLKRSNAGIYEEFFGPANEFSERKLKLFKRKLRQETNQIQDDLNVSKQHKKEWFKDCIKEIKAYRQ